jgi:hypothetical protein
LVELYVWFLPSFLLLYQFLVSSFSLSLFLHPLTSFFCFFFLVPHPLLVFVLPHQGTFTLFDRDLDGVLTKEEMGSLVRTLDRLPSFLIVFPKTGLMLREETHKALLGGGGSKENKEFLTAEEFVNISIDDPCFSILANAILACIQLSSASSPNSSSPSLIPPGKTASHFLHPLDPLIFSLSSLYRTPSFLFFRRQSRVIHSSSSRSQG